METIRTESLGRRYRMGQSTIHALKEFAAGDPSQLQQTAVLERLFTQSATLVSAVSDTVNDDELREQLSSVKTAAAALDSDRLPREQPDTIERFFRETSIALQRIDRAS